MDDDFKYALALRLLIVLAVIAAIVIVVFFLIRIAMRRKDSQLSRVLRELKIAQTELLKIDQMKSNFINSITHEIRTPLNAITGYSSLISSGLVEGEELDEYSQVIEENATKLSSLVDNLLYISTISDEQFRFERSAFSPASIIEELYILAEPQEHVLISTKCNISPTIMIHSDREKILSILDCLVSNSCKFTSSGTISITCEESAAPGRIVFSVADTGPGIPKEKVNDIFMKFVKVDDFKQGMGIGLYLAQKLTHLLGGKLSYDDSYTEGARFLLEIPLELTY